MDTKRYALFEYYSHQQVSEVVRLTDEQLILVQNAVAWKYYQLYYVNEYNDSYVIKSNDIMASLAEHADHLENIRKKKAESSRKRKLALYEKLKKELEGQ